MIKDLVSVIIPTYNRCEMLLHRIQEYREQSYKNLELIVVNDGSTDDTKRYIDDIKLDNFKVIHLHQNSGIVTIPRNIGITHSQGEFIAHWDDDVVQLPIKTEALVNKLKEDDSYSMVYGNRLDIRGIKGEYRTIVSVSDWNPLETPGIDNSQIMYRSNVYNTIPLIFCRRACDWELAKYLGMVGKIGYVNELVSKYIWHGTNRSSDPNTKNKPILLEDFKDYFKPGFKYLTV